MLTHQRPDPTRPVSPTRQDHNGGALKLELGAVGLFQGTSNFTDISILPADTGIRIFGKGAAIHSKVSVLCSGKHPAFGLTFGWHYMKC